MYGDLCPKLWTPQPNWLNIFMYGDLCPKLWTPQPNWRDIFVYGDLCPKLWQPSLTGLIYLCTGIYVVEWRQNIFKIIKAIIIHL